MDNNLGFYGSLKPKGHYYKLQFDQFVFHSWISAETVS
jgi:hypothetical protein